MFSLTFHCDNCVVRKSKAFYDFRFTFSGQKSVTLEKQNERIEAKYLIFHRINGKVLSD